MTTQHEKAIAQEWIDRMKRLLKGEKDAPSRDNPGGVCSNGAKEPGDSEWEDCSEF